jgi:hypothetical protein
MAVKPKLLILIHTEEEFNWGEPFSRTNRGVSHIQNLLKYQAMFDQFGVAVAYALSYPVVENEQSALVIKELIDSSKRVSIGMHCHPWVNPPYDELVNNYNSYPGNLPKNQERDKLFQLHKKIEKTLGQKPIFYLAGRYGIGKNTYDILNDLNVRIDFSPMPNYDYSDQDGPDFSYSPTHVTKQKDVTIIPHSSGFTGWLSNGGARPKLLNNKLLVKSRVSTIFSVLGGFSQVILSPEGFNLKQMKELTLKLIKSEHDIIVLSFHSTSISAGLNPFVASSSAERHFFNQLQQYLVFYEQKIKGDFFDVNNNLGN